MPGWETEKDGIRKYYLWWKSLSPDERARLLAEGGIHLDPDNADLIRRPDHYEVLEHASVTDDDDYTINEQLDLQSKTHTELQYSKEDLCRVVNTIVNTLCDTATDRATRMHILCCQVALGIGNPPTQSKIAKEFGLTRAGVSFRVKTIQQSFGVPPSHLMRSQATCDTYRSRAYRVHRERLAASQRPDEQEGAATPKATRPSPPHEPSL